MSRLRLTGIVAGVLIGTPLLVWAGWRLLRNPVADLPDTPGQLVTRETHVSDVLPRPEPSRYLEELHLYAGSNACEACHKSVCDSYHSHPMSRSLAKTIAASPLEDYTTNTVFKGPISPNYSVHFNYRVYHEQGQVFHEETVAPPDGDVLCRMTAPVEWAVGSGKRGRSYLINRDGRLYMSPITWYTEGQRWDLSPSYSRENRHFERRIVDGCVVCHAGLTRPVGDAPHVYQTPAFIEESIGCERCHGPGKAHIAARQAGLAEGQPDPIVNPINLEPRLRDSVCYQCHLQGMGRITRYGRSEFDFRPGDDITKVWAIFVRGAKVDEKNTTEAVGQAEQMFVSRCFSESAGRMSCLTCHDPHLVPAAEDEARFYRERCLTCHSAGQPECSEDPEARRRVSADDSCIVCHMPSLAANDVPHTSQTDHRIPRFRDASRQPPASAEERELLVFGNDAGQIPDSEVDRSLGILMVRNAEGSEDRILASRAIQFLKPWTERQPDDVEALETLGIAYWLTRDIESAKRAWDKALLLDPDAEGVLLHQMILCHDNGRLDEGIGYAQRLVAVNPWHFEHHARLAHMLGQVGRMPDGIASAQRAAALKPYNFQIHGWLAEAYTITGESELADKHRTLYEQFKPLERD